MPEESRPRQSLQRLAIGAAVLFLLVFAVYWPAVRGGFIWDDRLLVDKNPLVTGKLNLFSLWFQADFPLTWVAFWLQWLVWAKSPMGYHVVNLFMHALAAVLAWRVLLQLKVPGAWLGAALFALHPLCVASAAWISELKNTLSLVFYLLSALFYLDAESNVSSLKSKVAHSQGPPQEPPPQKHEAGTSDWTAETLDFSYWLSLGAFLLALLSKTSTVMLPFTLLLFAWWQRGRIARRDLVRGVPFFALALAFGSLTVWFQKHQAMGGVPVQTEGFAGRLAGAAWAIWFYLGKALLPLNLNMIYPRWTIIATRPLAWAPFILLAATFGLCWAFRRSWGRPLLFALAFFTIDLFPALGFFDMYYLALSRVSDHFAYLSLLGITGLVGAGLCRGGQMLSRIAHHSSPMIPFAGMLLLMPLAALSFQRSRILAHDETLWRDTLARNPGAWTAHNNLGCILAERQQYDDAVKEFQASVKENPRNAQAYANLARALAVQGKMSEAEAYLRTALQIKPNDADIQRSIGSMLGGQGKLKEALPHLREAVRLEPNAETRLQYAGLLYQSGDAREAISQYRQALSSAPNLLEALNNLAWLLATTPDPSLRNGSEAVRAAERACRLTNNQSAIHLGTLAAAYAEAGRFPDAVRTAELSIQIATARGQQQIVAMNQQFLNLYRAGKPWHQPLPAKPQNSTVNPR